MHAVCVLALSLISTQDKRPRFRNPVKLQAHKFPLVPPTCTFQRKILILLKHTFAFIISISRLDRCHFVAANASSVTAFGLEIVCFTLFIEVATFVDRSLWEFSKKMFFGKYKLNFRLSPRSS